MENFQGSSCIAVVSYIPIDIPSSKVVRVFIPPKMSGDNHPGGNANLLISNLK